MPNGIKFCLLPVTASTPIPASDDLESPFFLMHGRDPLDRCAGLFCTGDTRYMGDEKDLILFTELRKLWSTHTKMYKKIDC